jgi:DNA-binding PadR family transcriptional regulator
MVLHTLDVLGPAHGYAIAARLEQVSNGAVQLNMGTLYPALMRLEQRGLLRGTWGTTENNRRARFYGLTAAGRRELTAEKRSGTASPASCRPCCSARPETEDTMRILREWLVRLFGTFRRADPTPIFDRNCAHISIWLLKQRGTGPTTGRCRDAQRLRAGGVSQALDALRDQRGLPWLDAAVTGLAGLPKLMLRSPRLSIFATVTLAVAGVNLAVFTIVNALWLRPLPFRNPDRVVTITDGSYITLDAPNLTSRSRGRSRRSPVR